MEAFAGQEPAAVDPGAFEAALRAEAHVDGRRAYFMCEIDGCNDRALFVVRSVDDDQWRAVCGLTCQHMMARHLEVAHGFGSGDIWPFDWTRRHADRSR